MTSLHPGLALPLRLAFAAALLSLGGCPGSSPPADGDADAGTTGPTDAGGADDADASAASDAGCPVALVEDRSVYQEELPVLVIELAVDDLEGLAAVDEGVPGAEVRVRFREGSFGADAVAPNATLELRGQSTRFTDQKSYKLHVDSSAGLWRGQRELNLNKHPYDLTRVRNRLSFDLFRAVPHFTSLRTQFAHLVVNGESRGLYTQIEEADKRFLAAHGLDPDGTLYKARDFSFWQIDPATAADPTAFDLILEDKANADPAKIVRMTDALADPTAAIDDVIDAHFDRENYVTWLAVNLLLGNFDTSNQNFYLYSPSHCERWYFLPWDYDGALGWYEQPGNHGRPRWRAGLANWWDAGLHNPFLSVPANVDAVEERLAGLRDTVITDARVAALLAGYHDTVRGYVTVEPDRYHLPVEDDLDEIAQWEAEYERLGGVVASYVDEYAVVRERPMPVWLHGVAADGDLTFDWSSSYDMQGDSLSYDLLVSESPDFTEDSIVAERTGLGETQATIPALPPGLYFWHILARDDADPAEHWQISFIADEMFAVE
jgi:CotH protein